MFLDKALSQICKNINSFKFHGHIKTTRRLKHRHNMKNDHHNWDTKVIFELDFEKYKKS